MTVNHLFNTIEMSQVEDDFHFIVDRTKRYLFISWTFFWNLSSCSPVHSDSFPPEVITYDHWKQLKSEQSKLYPAWIKGVLLHGRKDKMQESLSEKLNSVLSTAPISDRCVCVVFYEQSYLSALFEVR